MRPAVANHSAFVPRATAPTTRDTSAASDLQHHGAALGSLSHHCPGEPYSSGSEPCRRASMEHAQRHHAVAPKVCNRDAEEGLVGGASGWRGPDTGPLVKNPALQAGGQGGPLRG